MASKLVIEFPDAMARESFLAWFCDGTGEQDFMGLEREQYAAEDGRDPIIRFTYDKAFPAWGYDPVKDGPDKVVVAHAGKMEP
jgi:hypothetical protein